MSSISWFPLYSVPQLGKQFDRRAARIAMLLLGVAILNAVDLVCTLFAQNVGQGLFNELNPVADTFLQLGLTHSLISYKILMTLSGLCLLWRYRANRLVIPGCWVLLLVYIGLSIIWCVWMSNASSDMELHLANAMPMDP